MTRHPSGPAPDSDFRNKSQEQMIEYAVRMRKRAEKAEAERDALRLTLDGREKWWNEQGLPQIQPAHDLLDALSVPECIHDGEHLCDGIAERIQWLAEDEGASLEVTTRYWKALTQIRDASDEVIADDLREHASTVLAAVRTAAAGGEDTRG